MKVSESLREAWRSVATGAASGALLAAATSAVAVGLIWFELVSVSGLADEAAAFQAGGAATFVLDSPGNVDGVACDRLAEAPDVAAAGAIRDPRTRIFPVAAPDNPVAVYDASAGFAKLLGVQRRARGLAVERSLAADFAVASGGYFLTRSGQLPVIATYDYPDDGRDPFLSRAAVHLAAPGRTYDQCWMHVWPYDADKEILLRTALTTSTTPGTETLTAQLNPRFGIELSATRDFPQRISRWGMVLGASLAALLSVGGTRRRRLELSLARHLGARRGPQSLQLVTETLLWSTPVVSCGAVTIVWFTVRGTTLDVNLALYGVRILIATVLGSLIGSWMGAVLIRESHLFHHFKTRN